MKNSVTSQLRKSIEKVTGYIMQERVYSDTRKNGLAVGVKVCYASYTYEQQNEIIVDMESKGYKLGFIRYNKSKRDSGYPTIEGIRFCFYKK